MTKPVERSTEGGRGPERGIGLRFVRSVLAVTGLMSLTVGCAFQRHDQRDGSSAGEAGIVAEQEIEEMLGSSSASWNAGDLDGFLDDYQRSEDLTFSGENGVSRGWEEVRARYLASYWAPGAERDSLRFEEMEVTPLGTTHALALGKYVLFQPREGGKVSSTGYFSLVLRRTDQGWKIIHDHTSAAPSPEGQGGVGGP